MSEIQTERLRLRPLTLSDEADVVALHQDTEVMRYITDGRPDTAERIREVLARWVKLHEETGWGFFAAEEKGAFAGWFHINPVKDTPGEYDVGYRLKRSCWGKGLATEGARALLAKLAWSNSARRVIARCMAANKASARVMEKLGLAYEGEYQETRFPGECQCATRYAVDWSTIIHRRVWLARQGMNTTVIGRLPSGWVVLGDNQTISGYSLLLSDPVRTCLNDVAAEVRATFTRDMVLVGDALLKATGARLMNYMILQNTDYALHAHVHPRYAEEPEEKRVTGPWAYFPPHPQRALDMARDGELLERIRRALQDVCAQAGVPFNVR